MNTPEAPNHYSNSEASAWKAGYEAVAAKFEVLFVAVNAANDAGIFDAKTSQLARIPNECRISVRNAIHAIENRGA